MKKSYWPILDLPELLSATIPRRRRAAPSSCRKPAQEIFETFHRYLYEKRLDVVKMDLDQLFSVYVLADYVDCPVFADRVFEVIYSRTSPPNVVYTHKYIQKVLTSTLPDQPLHKLMLDQISFQILQKKHSFKTEEAQEILNQVTSEMLVTLVETINNVGITDFSTLQLPIERYSKHVSRHVSSDQVPDSAQPFEPALMLTASETAESRVSRKALEYIMTLTGKTNEQALQALEDHACNSESAISSLARLDDSRNPFAVDRSISASGNTIPVPRLAYSSPTPNLTQAQRSAHNPNPIPNPNTPAPSRGGATRARGRGTGRGGVPRGRGGSG